MLTNLWLWKFNISSSMSCKLHLQVKKKIFIKIKHIILYMSNFYFFLIHIFINFFRPHFLHVCLSAFSIFHFLFILFSYVYHINNFCERVFFFLLFNIQSLGSVPSISVYISIYSKYSWSSKWRTCYYHIRAIKIYSLLWIKARMQRKYWKKKKYLNNKLFF